MDDTQITYRNVDPPKEHHINMLKNQIDTLEKMFKYVVKIHTTKRCLGTRQILGEEDEMQPNGRLFKKFRLGEYKWRSFIETELQAQYFGRGIRELGVQSRDKVVMFAETRAEWMIAAHGLFKQSCTIVTIYATLGEDGITHGVKETEVNVVITSHDCLAKLRNILKTIPKVDTIIYFEDQLHKTDTSGFGNVRVIPFSEVLKKGEDSKIGEFPAGRECQKHFFDYFLCRRSFTIERRHSDHHVHVGLDRHPQRCFVVAQQLHRDHEMLLRCGELMDAKDFFKILIKFSVPG